MSSFFAKTSARYLIIEYHWLITCRLWSEGFLISVFVHGESMIKKFWVNLRLFSIFFQKTFKHDKICYNST